jgi:hypothetical protein
MGGSCADGDKYRTSKNLLGVVELGPFPKQGPGVGGYNLYISKSKDGPFDKINDQPVLGYTRLMVPYLDPDKAYYFRMTSVSSRDVNKESAPGQVFVRKAQLKAD